MKERPIRLYDHEVRAIRAGVQTQFRRAFKLPKGHRWDDLAGGESKGNIERDAWYPGPWHVSEFRCPFGQPGERLWGREKFTCFSPGKVAYFADDPDRKFPSGPARLFKWEPSIHMPRWASRIAIEITGVRVERLQDISDADAIAEGIERRGPGWRWYTDSETYTMNPRTSYQDLWESINGPSSWDENPWVWVLNFKRDSVNGGSHAN